MAKHVENLRRAKIFIERLDYFDLVEAKRTIDRILRDKYSDKYKPEEVLIDPKTFKLSIPPELDATMKEAKEQIKGLMGEVTSMVNEFVNETGTHIQSIKFQCDDCGCEELIFEPVKATWTCTKCGMVSK